MSSIPPLIGVASCFSCRETVASLAWQDPLDLLVLPVPPDTLAPQESLVTVESL